MLAGWCWKSGDSQRGRARCMLLLLVLLAGNVASVGVGYGYGAGVGGISGHFGGRSTLSTGGDGRTTTTKTRTCGLPTVTLNITFRRYTLVTRFLSFYVANSQNVHFLHLSHTHPRTLTLTLAHFRPRFSHSFACGFS